MHTTRWFERWADGLRNSFDQHRFAPVHMVALSGFVAAVFGSLVNREAWGQGTCSRFSFLDFELTFSARSFFSLLRLAGDCRDGVLHSLVRSDIAFAIAYPFFLCALYLWVERYRRFAPNAPQQAPTRTGTRPPMTSSLLVLLPFAIGAFDIFAENLVLYFAAKLPEQSSSAAALVWAGSFGASCKWAMIALYVIGLVAMTIRGPRWHVVWRIRYSIFAVLFGAAPLLAVPQGQDILQRLVEGAHPLVRVSVAVLVIAMTALVIWYGARVLTRARDPGETPDAWEVFFERQIPRMVGLAFMLLSALAFARAGNGAKRFAAVAVVSYLLVLGLARTKSKRRTAVEGTSRWGAPGSGGVLQAIGKRVLPAYARVDPLVTERAGRACIGVVLGALSVLPDTLSPLHFLPNVRDTGGLRLGAYLLLAFAWVLYFVVYFRRDLKILREKEPNEALMILRCEREKGRTERAADFDISEIPRDVKAKVVVAALVSAAFFAMYTWATVPVARFVGPLVVLATATANMVFVGSFLAVLGRRLQFPIVLLLLALALAFSRWNDNHAVRLIEPSTRSDTGDARIAIDARLAAWLRAHGGVSPSADSSARATGRIPLVLVAAAGGGLRAAYWTALSLATLQDRDTTFASHVFAMSGVSGGSLGIGVFAAMRHDMSGSTGTRDCQASDRGPAQVMVPCVRRFMTEDYLSPVLAKLLAPDFAQWFLWFPVRRFDRAMALEDSWEQSYDKTMGDTTLQMGLRTLFTEAQAAQGVPPLLLNSTHVETGRRYIASTFAPDTVYLDAVDVLSVLGGPDLRLSTAMHNSARFTYVSPAGRLERHDGDAYGAVVDGGYFENSGLATLNDLRRALASLLDAQTEPALRAVAQRVDLVVLYLCNDPVGCRRDTDSASSRLATKRAAGGEWFAPLRALLATRDARGAFARAETARELAERPTGAHAGFFYQLNVCDSLSAPLDPAAKDSIATVRDRVVNPPLGWLLSAPARRWMDFSLESSSADDRGASCQGRNARTLADLLDRVRGARAGS
ncbi:MAG: hypothetical protein U0132_09965 [Gemmatimonadaceae bacterium]